MSDPRWLTEERRVERAVFVQPCEDGWDPRTVVRQLVWQDDAVHEEQLIFPSLRAALSYAQGAFRTEDGPHALTMAVPVPVESPVITFRG